MWYKNLEKYYLIKSIYSEVPKLSNVNIHEIKVYENGKRASITFDMPEFAEYPPTSWIREGYNATKVTCEFLNVSEFKFCSNNEENIVGNIVFEKNQSVKLIISGNINGIIKSEIGLIKEVEGYINKELFI
ncbi:hypothetical protein IMX26_03325 [Clostridium sp. 'deep sea']|uniref:Imm50 family immunity protein n=1 Tax=Clostridium sp. 'deep sea' TaxID=2779445 RepID=UPI0018964162|nr:Imm50 family immunity protein [Clostridium sp. 'deep sea']QOR35865.1 hypothetical protein IMX26_03325 [Clostridium sp. 'deep sea']